MSTAPHGLTCTNYLTGRPDASWQAVALNNRHPLQNLIGEFDELLQLTLKKGKPENMKVFMR